MGQQFKDHFSGHAEAYNRYRPSYPRALFAALANLPANRIRAWDCATGGGQAAQGLAPFFQEVIATDASASQIQHAQTCPNVTYAVASAENSGLPTGTIDLINVAQAAHWFDLETFYREARRVAAPAAVLALSSYGLLTVNPELDTHIKQFYHAMAAYWPRERKLIDEKYKTLPFPFPEKNPPQIRLEAHWNLAQLIGYLGTWSAVARYRAQQSRDPLALVIPKLTEAWADPTSKRIIKWPLYQRVGTVN